MKANLLVSGQTPPLTELVKGRERELASLQHLRGQCGNCQKPFSVARKPAATIAVDIGTESESVGMSRGHRLCRACARVWVRQGAEALTGLMGRVLALAAAPASKT